MNQYFKEENGEVFLWNTYNYFNLNRVGLPGFSTKVGTIEEINPKTGDWFWMPSHGYSDAACWNMVDESFLGVHKLNRILDNYRYVFLLKN